MFRTVLKKASTVFGTTLGKTDTLLVEKQKWGKGIGAPQREEGEDTEPRKLVIKPLAKHLKGKVWEDKVAQQLNSWEGVDGVVFVGFSPDRHPEVATS